MTAKHIQQRNQRYREGTEPDPTVVAAYEQVVQTGNVDEEAAEALVDRLYEPFPSRVKETGREEPENGLMKGVFRKDHGIDVRVSLRLWQQQPIGVLLRPINDRVRRGGEALRTGVVRRSADVEPNKMPVEHISLKYVPTPIWLQRYIGESGFPIIE